ncbi:hypothetical protein NPS01_32550 [Nocardioides psychrotolerans]|uniref:hypothetical protein n=1 Tax=Nocardioides psychrotolerans TaxID=1005945 RepID=UPI001196F353|nr:hypothetical protein [Nocardioides psychrotolerans]GEP39592.1 hypothetical protein NPS01_32550 [Nocardioides psychrotolerans]
MLKQPLVVEEIAHAALVYEGDLAVAWAEHGSPEELPGIQHRKAYVATAEPLPDVLYNDTRTRYEREGFTHDRPKGLGNFVMVRDVGLRPRD